MKNAYDKTKLKINRHTESYIDSPYISVVFDNTYCLQGYIDSIFNNEIVLKLEKKMADISLDVLTFMLTSLIRSTISKSRSLFTNEYILKFDIKNTDLTFFKIFEMFGFSRIENYFLLNLKPDIALAYQKKHISKLVENYPKYGASIFIDVKLYPNLNFEILQSEYNDFAWGFSNWARHHHVSEDEASYISNELENGRVLEIGAGSGRLTSEILKKNPNLSITDYKKEITENLKLKFTHLDVILDNIENTKIKKKYEHIVFLENGLGNILNYERRKKVIENMLSLTQPEGFVHIAVRSMGDIPMDQLFIATQDEYVFGLYHVFGVNEIENYIQELNIKDKVKVTKTWGHLRPAGGKQIFYKIQKMF